MAEPTPEQKLAHYEEALKGAWALLEEYGWYPFGYHAHMSPCPELTFSKQVDEVGDPLFEKRVYG